MRNFIIASVVFSTTICLAVDKKPSRKAASSECTDTILTEVMIREARLPLPASFSKSKMVTFFQKEHVTRYQKSDVLWKTFYPMWIFKSKSLLESLFASFPLSEDHQIEREWDEFTSIEAFLTRWEKDFTKAGGVLSPLWTEKRKLTGRVRFLRRYYLELALYHAHALGVPDDKLANFTAQAHDPMSFLEGIRGITLAFGDTERFRKALRPFMLRKAGLRVPFGPHATESVRETRAALQEVAGVTVADRPMVLADEREQRKKEWVRLGLVLLKEHPGELFPLALLFGESTNTGGYPHIQLSFHPFEEIDSLFRGFGGYVLRLNEAMRENVISLNHGAQYWERELLIQAALQLILDFGITVDELDLNTTDPLFRRARLGEHAMKGLIRLRLNALMGD